MEYKIKPWGHQLIAIDRAKSLDEFALFLDMGTGKTSTAINILRHKMMQEKRAMRTLIFCPVVVCENWRREFKMHSKITGVVVLSGSQAQRVEKFKKETALGSTVFVTNYEALHMENLYKEFMNWRTEILICDESHRAKNPAAKTTKKLINIADFTKYRYILTGTPILNTPMDIWSQFRILDKGESFGSNFFAFRNRWFYDKNAGMPSHKYFPDWKPQPGLDKAFNELIYRKAMRVTKQECMDLPPMLRQKIYVSMDKKQEKIYREMEEDFLTFLDGKAVTASMALTKALRLQQIVSGFVKTVEDKETPFDNNPRLTALGDLLEDLAPAHKVIVWANFRQNYRDIKGLCTSLKLEFAEVHGEVSAKERQVNVDRFQSDPACRIMIANQSAGGEGVNLTAASYCIFYSRDFSLKNDLQAEARNYRGGSEIHEKITRIDLVCRDTIDEHILEALAKKIDISENILSLKDRMKKRESLVSEDDFSQ